MTDNEPIDFSSRLAEDQLTRLLSELYLQRGIPLDRLAYTTDFDQIYEDVTSRREYSNLTKADVFQKMLGLRKAGILPRITA